MIFESLNKFMASNHPEKGNLIDNDCLKDFGYEDKVK
jgi:hypothetical protein